MKNGLSRLMGALFSMMLTIAVLTGTVRFLACSAPVMEALMIRFAPAEDTLLPEGEYPAVTRMMTGYLAGRTDTFQHVFKDPDGIDRVCFHDYEQQHMADCRELIRLDETVCLISAGAALLFAGIGWSLKNKKAFCLGGHAGSGLFLLLMGGTVIRAVTDFSGFFMNFHQLAFTNDLWLLDPRTDLLIRLMPEEFFVAYGVTGAVILLMFTGMLNGILFGFIRKERQKK